MIELKGIGKKFEDVTALADVSGQIHEGNVFGLVGTNGAGKSTCLRMVAGVLAPDTGEVLVDEKNVYQDPEIRREVFFIADDPYYFPNATPRDMMKYYAIYYSCFDEERFHEMVKKFGLEEERRIRTFSKGMKKQLAVILGICANTKYLLCDETFDGLDPVMRQAVKSIFAAEMINRDFTPVIASHNLRELEDICDHVGLLHRGGMLLSREVEELKSNLHRVQCAVDETQKERLLAALQVVKMEQRGSLLTLTVRGEEQAVMESIHQVQPVFAELIPLTLEEIFVSETEVAGYDVKDLLF